MTITTPNYREVITNAAILAARQDPMAFALLTARGQYQYARHQKHMFDAMRQAAENNERLIMSVSVRHSKSVTCSQVFPAWWLGHHPHDRIILGTSESGLASTFSGKARDLLNEWGQPIFGTTVYPGSRSRTKWNTSQNGQMLDGGITAVGRQGSPEGRGGSIIIDDPYRSFLDAMSPLTREQVKEWWLNTLAPRMEPDSFAVVLCARWHEDDLSGFLMREYGTRWREVRLPAICDREDDPLGREVGEALWPERWSLERLEQARAETTSLEGSATFEARYQQTPLSLKARMFPADEWQWIDEGDPILGKVVKWVTAWDLAATDGGGDWTVGVTMGRLPDNRVVIRDVVRVREGADRRDRTMCAAAGKNGRRVTIRIPQDPGAAGKMEVVRLKRLLAGHHVVSALVSGSKQLRAMGWSSCVQSGSALIVRSPEARALVACHSNFTGRDGGLDDDVDAAADAYNWLMSAAAGRARIGTVASQSK